MESITLLTPIDIRQVKRRVKQPPKDKSEDKGRSDHKGEEREELDFQFDEELDTPPPTGRHNAFSEWFVMFFRHFLYHRIAAQIYLLFYST